jgi:hypothetical protein
MKKKDISIVVVVAIVSAVVSFFLSGVFISSAEDRKQSVEVAPAIVSGFTESDDRYFNQNSMNPTQTIVISPETNPNPFKN